VAGETLLGGELGGHLSEGDENTETAVSRSARAGCSWVSLTLRP
jgi:hypothetical protein